MLEKDPFFSVVTCQWAFKNVYASVVKLSFDSNSICKTKWNHMPDIVGLYVFINQSPSLNVCLQKHIQVVQVLKFYWLCGVRRVLVCSQKTTAIFQCLYHFHLQYGNK